MAKMIETTQTSLARIFARFGRSHDRLEPVDGKAWRGGHWYDCDVCARGL